MSLRGADGKPLKVGKAGPMGFKPLFGTPQRFTTPDKANIIVVYDALNLFFTMSLAKQMLRRVSSGSRMRRSSSRSSFSSPGMTRPPRRTISVRVTSNRNCPLLRSMRADPENRG